MKKKIIFMGTPDFACAILDALMASDYEVVAVVSQPDKKIGRKQILAPTKVKELALSYNLPVLQPISIRHDYQEILAYQADLFITCAYGQMIPDEVLLAPPFGSINVHASLLPKLRGGAPIHKAIINGDSVSGVSIMRMVKQMDAGAVMSTIEVPIFDEDTTGDLYDRLKHAGAKLLMNSLPAIFDGSATFMQQDESQATFAYNITKDEERIVFHHPVQMVYNQIRGLIPNPVGYGIIQGKKIKFYKVRKHVKTHQHEPGFCAGLIDQGFAIACLGGYVLVDEVQMEGKGIVDASSFYNGAGRNMVGRCFANE